ncbi:T9SS type A sorting domain-containing protein, partial [bacterium BMS3Abin03]|nr:T9SS type A sorting domain-containing protein [bacterium BMS3Abin03]
YDYAATNFRSDTSVAEGDDPSYAWGITVANQALKFLEWAGYDATGVRLTTQNSPDEFKLFPNYPNPFNPITKISWQSPIGGWQSLKVYDILGKEVATLVDEEKPAGSFEIKFDASGLPSGVYFYQLKAGNFIKTNKMILIR